MKKLKPLFKHLKDFLTKFNKTDKKRGSPKLIKANRKTANILVLLGISFFFINWINRVFTGNQLI